MCDNIFANRFVFHSHHHHRRCEAAHQQLQLRFISLRSMARALGQLTLLRMLRARVNLLCLFLVFGLVEILKLKTFLFFIWFFVEGSAREKRKNREMVEHK